MKQEDEMFKKVELDSRMPNPCSPEEPSPLFLGILINAPSRVFFKKGEKVEDGSAFAIIPICGLYMLQMSRILKYINVIEAMRLVAVDKETNWEFFGRVAEPIPGAPKQKYPALSREEVANMVSGGYFNPNLAERVPLPEKSGKYDVHVELGERDSDDFIQSNVVTIEIIEEQEE